MKKNRKRQGLYRLAKNLRGKHQCENDERLDFTINGTKRSKCTDPATYVYYDFRFGRKGEPSIVDTETLLCDHCAEQVADSIAECRAEAAAS